MLIRCGRFSEGPRLNLNSYSVGVYSDDMARAKVEDFTFIIGMVLILIGTIGLFPAVDQTALAPQAAALKPQDAPLSGRRLA